MKDVQSKAQDIKVILEECRKRNITLDDLLEVVTEVAEGRNSFYSEKVSNPTSVEQIVLELGITPNLKGYDYVVESITYCIDNGNCAISKELYPYLATKFKTTSEKVERGVRHAIEVSWRTAEPEDFYKYFGYVMHTGKRKRPTNAQYIFGLVNYLKKRVR